MAQWKSNIAGEIIRLSKNFPFIHVNDITALQNGAFYDCNELDWDYQP